MKLLLIVFNSQRTTELCGGSDRAAGKHSLKHALTSKDVRLLVQTARVTPDHLNLHPASD